MSEIAPGCIGLPGLLRRVWSIPAILLTLGWMTERAHQSHSGAVVLSRSGRPRSRFPESALRAAFALPEVTVTTLRKSTKVVLFLPGSDGVAVRA